MNRREWLAGTAALATAGCARTDKPLIFWGMGREGEVAQELLQGFTQETGVPVQVEQLPWTAAHEKLLTAFAGDATPDIAQLGNTWVPELAALGALEPLDPWLTSGGFDHGDYFNGIWQTNQVDNQLLGLPWYVDTRLIYYRSDLLAQVGWRQPPRSWAEWLQCMEALSKGPVPHPLLLPSNEFEPLLSLALQTEDRLLRDDDTRGNFSSPGFRRALSFYLDLIRRGYAPLQSNQEISNLWLEFSKGRFAFYISGPWNIGEFRRRLPADFQSRWTTAPLPGPNGPGASIAGGASLAVFRRSQRKPDAWKLLEYLSRPAIQGRFFELTGSLPPREKSWELPRLAADAQARAYREQLGRAKPVPPVPEWERIVQEMQNLAAHAAHDGTSAEATAAAIDRIVDKILEKRRWMRNRK